MIQTITLSQARAWDACQSGIDGVVAHLGREPDPDEPIPLTVVLDALGLSEALWCLAHLDHPLLVRWATDCAEAAALVAEPIVVRLEAEHPEDRGPRQAMDIAAALRAALRAGAPREEVQRLSAVAYTAYTVVDAVYATSGAACVAAGAVLAAYAAAYTAGANIAAEVAEDIAAAVVAADYAAAVGVVETARQKMRLWCRERLKAYLEGCIPGPVSIQEIS